MDLEGTEAPLEDIWGIKDDEPYLTCKQEVLSGDESEVVQSEGRKESRMSKLHIPETKQTKETGVKLKDAYACDRCNYKTEDFMTFITHKNKHEEEDKLKASLFTCGFCKFATPNPALMTEHIKNHLTVNPSDPAETNNSSLPKSPPPSHEPGQTDDANCDNENTILSIQSSSDTDRVEVEDYGTTDDSASKTTEKVTESTENSVKDSSVFPVSDNCEGGGENIGESICPNHRGPGVLVEEVARSGCGPDQCQNSATQSGIENATDMKASEIVQDSASLNVSFCENEDSEFPLLNEVIQRVIANGDESGETECADVMEEDVEPKLNSSPSTPESLTPIIPVLTYGRHKRNKSNEHSDQVSSISSDSGDIYSKAAAEANLKWVSVKVARYRGPSVCIPSCDQIAETQSVADNSIDSVTHESCKEKVSVNSPSHVQLENEQSPNCLTNLPFDAEQTAPNSRSSTPCKPVKKRKRRFLTSKSERRRPASDFCQTFSSHCLYEVSQADAVNAKFFSDEGKQIVFTKGVKIVRESTNDSLKLATQIDAANEAKCKPKNTTTENVNQVDKTNGNGQIASIVRKEKSPKPIRRKSCRRRKKSVTVANPVPIKCSKKPQLLSGTAMMAKVKEITNRQKQLVVKFDGDLPMDVEENGDSSIKVEHLDHTTEHSHHQISEETNVTNESTSVDTKQCCEVSLSNSAVTPSNSDTDNPNVVGQTDTTGRVECSSNCSLENASNPVPETLKTAVDLLSSDKCDASDSCSQSAKQSLVDLSCGLEKSTVLVSETNLVSMLRNPETVAFSTQKPPASADHLTETENANETSEPAQVLEYLVTAVSTQIDLSLGSSSSGAESSSNANRDESQKLPVKVRSSSPGMSLDAVNSTSISTPTKLRNMVGRDVNITSEHRTCLTGCQSSGEDGHIPESTSSAFTSMEQGDCLQSESEFMSLNHVPSCDIPSKSAEPLSSIENTYSAPNRTRNTKAPIVTNELPAEPETCERTETEIAIEGVGDKIVGKTLPGVMVQQPQFVYSSVPSSVVAISNSKSEIAEVGLTATADCAEHLNKIPPISPDDLADDSQSKCETLAEEVHVLVCDDVVAACDQAEKLTKLRNEEEIERAVEAISEKDSCCNGGESQVENWLGKSLMESGSNSPSFEKLLLGGKTEDSFRWLAGGISIQDDSEETERAVQAIMCNADESAGAKMSSPDFIIKDSFSLRETTGNSSSDNDCQVCDEQSVSEFVEDSSPCDCLSSNSLLELMERMLVDVDSEPVCEKKPSVFEAVAIDLSSSQHPKKQLQNSVETTVTDQLEEQNGPTKRLAGCTIAPMRMHKKPKRDIILRYENELSSKTPLSDSVPFCGSHIGQVTVDEKSWELNNNNNDSTCTTGLEFPTDVFVENYSHSVSGSLSGINSRQLFDSYHPKKKLARSRSSAVPKHSNKKRKRRTSHSRLHIQPISTQNNNQSESVHKKQYRCEFCEYVTDNKVDLFSHSSRIHSEEEKVYICDKCEYITYRHSKLTAHEKVHQEPDEFELEDQRLQAQQKRAQAKMMVSACQRLANLGNGGSLANNSGHPNFKYRRPRRRKLHPDPNWKTFAYTQET